MLADEGLAAAVEALAEDGRVPVRIRSLPEGRFPPRVETAAYIVVAEAARAATRERRGGGDALATTRSSSRSRRSWRRRLDVVELEDRVGALDGSLAVERREDGGVTIRAELPCES